MGALHAGHARLIEQARRECQRVVVSIFVNPLQFDRSEDLQRYPKSMDADLAMCNQLGVDIVFAPTAQEMYPSGPYCTVVVRRLADHLCGLHRPGHFNGVATVVLKLFQIVQPDRAYFGEKDAQQLAIVRRLVADFNVPVEIVGVPTVREPDGLALSSRNRLLAPSERESAVALYRALVEADRQISAGGADANAVKAKAASLIPNEPGLRLEYLEVVDPEDMQPVSQIVGPVRVAGALWVGSTRLIDNLYSEPPASRGKTN
jgi:pantoate--beta-alanine ligase